MKYYVLVLPRQQLYTITDENDNTIVIILKTAYSCYGVKSSQERGTEILDLPLDVKMKSIKTCLENNYEL